MLNVQNFLDFTIIVVLHPTFIRKLCYKLSSIVTFTFKHIFLSKLCLLYWTASETQSCRVRLIQRQNSRYLWCPIWRKVDKKANLHGNWNMQTLFWCLLNIFAEFHQNWSFQFWAIAFQSCAFLWDTVYCGFHQHLNLPLEEGNIQMEYAHCSFADTSVSVRLSYWSPINGTSTLMPLRSSRIFKSLAWSNKRFSWMCFRCQWLLLLSIIDQTIIGMRLSKASVISWAAMEVDQVSCWWIK